MPSQLWLGSGARSSTANGDSGGCSSGGAGTCVAREPSPMPRSLAHYTAPRRSAQAELARQHRCQLARTLLLLLTRGGGESSDGCFSAGTGACMAWKPSPAPRSLTHSTASRRSAQPELTRSHCCLAGAARRLGVRASAPVRAPQLHRPIGRPAAATTAAAAALRAEHMRAWRARVVTALRMSRRLKSVSVCCPLADIQHRLHIPLVRAPELLQACDTLR